MWGTSNQETLQQRLALLKQQQRELQDSFTRSHASLAETQEIETKLLSVAEEIAELEAAIALRSAKSA